MDVGSFSDGLMDGFSFVENIRDRRAAREMQARQMQLREEDNRRANAAEQRAIEQHQEVMERAQDARFNEQAGRMAQGYRALLAEYGSPDKIPDDELAPYLDFARKAQYGEDGTKIDKIHRAKDGSAVMEISGSRPDGSTFSGKPMTVSGGTDDKPIVFGAEEPARIANDFFARFDEKVVADTERRRGLDDIHNVLGMVSGTSGAPQGSGAAPPAGHSGTVVAPPLGPSAPPPPAPQASKPSETPPAIADQARPLSLADQQAQFEAANPKQPDLVDRAVSGAKRLVASVSESGKRATADEYRALFDMKDQRAGVVNLRKNPEAGLDLYMYRRADLPADVRAKADAHFRPALEARASAIQNEIDQQQSRKIALNDVVAAGDRGYHVKEAQSKLSKIQAQLDTMASQTSVTAQADIKGSQKAGEQLAQKVTPALQQVSQQPGAGRPTPAKMQADKQLVVNMQGKKRFTDAQLDSLGRMVQQKMLSLEQATRLIQTGELDAPHFMNFDPTHPLVKISANGTIETLYSPPPGLLAAKYKASADKVLSAMDKDRRSFIGQLAKDEEQKRGKAAKGTASDYEAGFVQWARSASKELKDTFGYDVYDTENDRVNFGAMDVDQLGLMWKGYIGSLDARKAEEGKGAIRRIIDTIGGGSGKVPTPVDKMIEAGARPQPASSIGATLARYRQKAAELQDETVLNMSDEELAQALQDDGRL